MRKLIRPQLIEFSQINPNVCARFLSLANIAVYRLRKHPHIRVLYQKDELVNDIFINGYWRNYYDKSDIYLVWIMKLDAIRYLYKISKYHSKYQIHLQHLDSVDYPVNDAAMFEIKEYVHYLLRKANLSISSLQMIKLYYWDGLTQKDVAKVMNLSRITVNKTLKKCLCKMRKVAV